MLNINYLNPSIRHIIKRQLLELQGLSPADADGIEHRLLPLFNKKILPLIDQYCSRLSPNEEPFRIERLELDIGSLDATRLEEDFAEKAMARLKIYFEQLIKTQASQQQLESKELLFKKATLDQNTWQANSKQHYNNYENKPHSHLELFRYFVETGSLPWWADPATSGLVNDTSNSERTESPRGWSNPTVQDPVGDSLRYLLEHTPESLINLMTRWVRQEDYLRRILRQVAFSDWLALAALPTRIPPSAFATMIDKLEDLLLPYLPWRSMAPYRLREHLGLKLLTWAYLQPVDWQNPASFWKGLLLQLASVQHHIAPDQQILVWRRQFKDKPRNGNELAAIIGQLWESRKKEVVEKTSPPVSQADLLKLINRLLVSRPLPTALETELQQMSTQLTGQALSIPELNRLARRLEQLERVLSAEPKLPHPGPDAFSEADELFVHNAGLVILWPFLSHFFENLGLVKEKVFVDEAAAHRAAGLLQFLADGQPEPVEYHCALNKILCGLDWDSVLDFGEPVTIAEKEAGEEFLHAVITHAPILKDMSIDGFRGTFLLRKGILKAGQGMWQLYVERETYDIILDRFPWSWTVVKLPWMEWAVRVEWGE